MIQKLEEKTRRAAKNSLIDFTKFTKENYQAAAHHRLTASYLERVERGEIKRLMIFEPPRHGKSELSTRRFPAWFLGRNPGKQIISASYNSDLASDFGRDVRNLINDELYQQVFPGMGLRQDSKAADRWNTLNGGCYIAAGVGGGITGRGADLGLIDDPIKDRKEANSQTTRDNIWNWYVSTFYTRLMPGAAIVLTLTRWHEDDLAGRLLKAQKEGGDRWTVLTLPAIATGPDELRRQEGEALWPAWYPKETLEKIKLVIGSFEFASLYQQAPYVEEGNIFKRSWWQYFRETPKQYDEIIQSWDTAFETGEENDYCACVTLGVLGTNIHIIDLFLQKLEFPDLKRAVVVQANKFNPNAVLVEEKASGKSLIQELRRNTRIPLIGRKADRDKVTRAQAVTPMIEGGRVFLPEWSMWKDDYIASMAAFPTGAHDDDVDATTQGLNYLRSRTYVAENLNIPVVSNWDPFERRAY